VTHRRWVLLIVIMAIVGASLVTGAFYLGRTTGRAAANAAGAQVAATVAARNTAELSAEITLRQHEIKVLQTQIETLNAASAKYNSILGLAYVAILQFDQQLKAICAQLRGCTQVPFTLPTTTTTRPVSPPRATTTTRPAVIITTTTTTRATTTTTRPRHGHKPR
jgi:hypothetical protein